MLNVSRYASKERVFLKDTSTIKEQLRGLLTLMDGFAQVITELFFQMGH